VNIVTSTSGAKWLVYLCVALLMITTVAQAAHFCGALSTDLNHGTQLRADSANSTLCLTCLMAQSAAALLLAITFTSVLRRRVPVSPLQIHPRALLESFQLYVRPPPIF
jgi:hypothetical protein